MKKLVIQDLNLKDKKVLLRVDFNVPLNDQGQITDDSRITAAIETIHYILKQNGSVIILSHLGRPDGKKDPRYSLKVCADRLAHFLNQNVIMANDCIGIEVNELKKNLKPKEVLVLENVRFHQEEQIKDQALAYAQKLAQYADVYVNDAFGCSHRDDASIVALATCFPNAAAMGFLIQKELQYLGDKLSNPRKPFAALIGGSKVSSKMGLLKCLVSKVDKLLIGGAMAHTFLKALGYDVGQSKVEENYFKEALDLMRLCKSQNVEVVFPIDLVFASEIKEGAKSKLITLKKGECYQGIAVDIGDQTIIEFTKHLQNVKTLFWNGPFGVFEITPFGQGTFKMAQMIASLDCLKIVGGGDSVAAINQSGLQDHFDHLSTGGGASIEFIEHQTLIGVEALSNKN